MKKVLLITLTLLLISAAAFAWHYKCEFIDIVTTALVSGKIITVKNSIPKFLDSECDCSARKAHKLDFKDVLYVPKNCIMSYAFEAQGIVLNSNKLSFNEQVDLQGSLASYLDQTGIPFRFPIYKFSESGEINDDGPELRFFIFHDPSFDEPGDIYPFWDGNNWAWKNIKTNEIIPTAKRDKNGMPEGHPNYLKD